MHAYILLDWRHPWQYSNCILKILKASCLYYLFTSVQKLCYLFCQFFFSFLIAIFIDFKINYCSFSHETPWFGLCQSAPFEFGEKRYFISAASVSHRCQWRPSYPRCKAWIDSCSQARQQSTAEKKQGGLSEATFWQNWGIASIIPSQWPFVCVQMLGTRQILLYWKNVDGKCKPFFEGLMLR